jgi:hypothetical protein
VSRHAIVSRASRQSTPLFAQCVVRMAACRYHGGSGLFASASSSPTAAEAKSIPGCVPTMARSSRCVWARSGRGRRCSRICAGTLQGVKAPPAVTLNNVCNIWQRVCRDVAAEPARQRVLFPSRLSKDWRPEVVPPAVSASPPAAVLAPYVSALPAQALSPASCGGGKGRVIDEAGRARGLKVILGAAMLASTWPSCQRLMRSLFCPTRKGHLVRSTRP